MNRPTVLIVAVATAATVAGTVTTANAARQSSGAADVVASAWARPAPSAPASTTLSAKAAADLQFSREEERMARDLYRYIADHYNQALPFANITVAEQRHFDSIGTLLTRYKVADPAAGKAAGSYANADLQALYDGWKAQADKSLAEAYQVGIALEKRDIADLERITKEALPNDVSRVYAALLNGSQHHLTAFTAAADGKTVGMGGGPGTGGQWMGRGGPGKGQGNGQTTGPRGGMGQGQGRMGTGSGDCPMGDLS